MLWCRGCSVKVQALSLSSAAKPFCHTVSREGLAMRDHANAQLFEATKHSLAQDRHKTIYLLPAWRNPSLSFFFGPPPADAAQSCCPSAAQLATPILGQGFRSKKQTTTRTTRGGGESLLHGIAARQDLYQDEHLWRGSLGIISSGCNLRAKGLCSASRAKKNKTIATDAVLCRGGSGHTKHTHT